MFSSHFPQLSPQAVAALVIALMFMAQLLFGLLYNWLFYKLHLPAWTGVMFGVGVTVLIEAGFFWNQTFTGSQWLLLTGAAFAGSGIPMAFGAVRKQEAESHKRRPIPNHVKRSLEEIARIVHSLIDDIERVTEKNITAKDLLRWTNDLHEVHGMTRCE